MGLFDRTPFKPLRKELSRLYDRKHKLQSDDLDDASVQEELDAVVSEIDTLMEGRYAREVFECYVKKKPDLVRIRTGEIVTWQDAFGDSYNSITKSQKHELVGLVEGGSKYRLK